jgi:hypothetical protein
VRLVGRVEDREVELPISRELRGHVALRRRIRALPGEHRDPGTPLVVERWERVPRCARLEDRSQRIDLTQVVEM